jgi:fructosamine-3-kinase
VEIFVDISKGVDIWLIFFMTDLQSAVSKVFGNNHVVLSTYNVSGGYINQTYKVITNNGKYFVKTNSANAYPKMFLREMEGLQLLGSTKTLYIPKVYGQCTINNKSFLFLEWIEQGAMPLDFYTNLGESLAKMHLHSAKYFGLNRHNYIGSLPQYNTIYYSWPKFFIKCRIEPMLLLAIKAGQLSGAYLNQLPALLKNAEKLFVEEPPALLHGDLWSGNVMVNEYGLPTLIDPAVYYGNREMDIAMTCFTGKWHNNFYEAYNRTYPLQAGWEQRVDFCLIYYYLVHLVLFGNAYLPQTKLLIAKFTK